MVKHVLFLLMVCVLIFFCYCAIFDEIAEKNDPEKNCECIDYDCGCCTQLKVKYILDGKLCGNFSYLPDQYGISVTITYNDRAIYNETVSAKNPPSICIIHFDKQVEICLKLYDLDIKNKCFSGCGEFEIRLFKLIPLKKLTIGCFGEDCKKLLPLLIEIENVFNYTTVKTKKQVEPQPYVVLI